MVQAVVDSSDEIDELKPSEQQRIDALLSSARSAHYLSILVAATAISLSFARTTQELTVPVLQVRLPTPHAAVALYILTIGFAAAADRMFRVAYYWMPRDPRRPPYPWIALGPSAPNYLTVSLWIGAPIVATAAALTHAAGGGIAGPTLVWAGIFLAAMPRIIDKYLPFIRQRQDHRGGPATLSIWLLYSYRVMRHAVTTGCLLLLVLAAVPEWRNTALRFTGYTAGVILGLVAVRGIAGSLHKRIDRIGPRFGFPGTNVHDYSPKLEVPGPDA